jgi:hypothetical protein
MPGCAGGGVDGSTGLNTIVLTRGAAQLRQNLASSLFSVPHCLQNIIRVYLLKAVSEVNAKSALPVLVGYVMVVLPDSPCFSE